MIFFNASVESMFTKKIYKKPPHGIIFNIALNRLNVWSFAKRRVSSSLAQQDDNKKKKQSRPLGAGFSWEITDKKLKTDVDVLAHQCTASLGCKEVNVADYTLSFKSALERLSEHSSLIKKTIPSIQFYRIIIVADIVGYCCDIENRDTLWIPSDFAIEECLKYLSQECTANEIVPISTTFVSKAKQKDYHFSEPVELVKFRERIRTFIEKDDTIKQSFTHVDRFQISKK
ncbi:hypothetical protein RFI_26511 [Reticulomyxa filosa]|uniref:Uncharacterized protein n=1 Tax=Reticulomyxa filosa TaxID=46433 RepID=X6MCY0_RETFI|nr:hypothetical protein RFI_26511 [Reticulomyxa filosa]|eukprot:ETO10865.1 hypothetical protein RFI_26511 [Reticulomyxa filosa]